MTGFPWPQWEPRLKYLAAQGLNRVQAASILAGESGVDLTPEVLRKKAVRMGIDFEPAKPEDKEFEERRAYIKKRWMDGASAGHIALELALKGSSLSRAAVMGVVRRADLVGREKGNVKPYERKLRPKKPQAEKPIDRPKPRLVAPMKPKVPAMPDPSLNCSILDLTFDTCRWIMGDLRTPLEPIYCGGKASTRPWGKMGQAACPYCDWHANMAHAGPARDLSRFKAA